MQEESMKKRIITLLLCIAMLAGLISSAVLTAAAGNSSDPYRAGDMAVPTGWDYIEVSSRKELIAALEKHKWWENDYRPQPCFIRLTADISVGNSEVGKEPALIYAWAGTTTTLDLNGHQINGTIMAMDDELNRTWSTLNINLQYGAVREFTFRITDLAGGGGVSLNSGQYCDGPANAVSINATYIRDLANIPGERVTYRDAIPKVIIDGGTYYMYTESRNYVVTDVLQGSMQALDSNGDLFWDARSPYTRSAIGFTGCSPVINRGHFTAKCYCNDNIFDNHCRKYVASVGLGDFTAADNLNINGGDFDGDAYSVFYYSFGAGNPDTVPFPVLNGGTYKGGIMFCSTIYSYWNGINENWELDPKSKDLPVDMILPENAKMYMDGTPVDPRNTDFEDIGLPHDITIESAPYLTGAELEKPELLTGRSVNIYLNYNKAPDNVEVQHLVTTIRGGQEIQAWTRLEGSDYYKMPAGSTWDYRAYIPGRTSGGTETVRVTARFGNIRADSEPYEIRWVDTPDYAFTVGPAVVPATGSEPCRIIFNFNYPDMLQTWSLNKDVNRDHWSSMDGIDYRTPDQTDDGNYWIYLTEPANAGENKSIYCIFLDYSTGTSDTDRVYSEEFTVTSDMLSYSHVHSWSGAWDYCDENGHARICASCGSLSDIVPHNPGPAATEESPQVCTDCGFVIVPKLGKGQTEVIVTDPEQGSQGTDPGAELEGASSWAKDEVKAAIDAGLVPAELRKNYTSPVKRGQVAKLFINLLEKASGKTVYEIMAAKGTSVGDSVFTDTADTDVLAANALGIIKGTGGGRFTPDGNLKRAQITAVINRIAGVMGHSTEGYTHGFTDITDNYAWADPELGWSVYNGIILGVGGNKFNPGGDLTVEQTILIVYRAYNVLK